ncbi:hypothetical protein D6B99_06635 [Arachidicoccus soli]|uniref:Uncharacterized protein n=1 Tax=Arachidicoccus soli TaxID=2341117 RepID=A0A386HND3_9BACT|nr:hypothetical protein D6B99_06635 [Arachidicoccus soli]
MTRLSSCKYPLSWIKILSANAGGIDLAGDSISQKKQITSITDLIFLIQTDLIYIAASQVGHHSSMV